MVTVPRYERTVADRGIHQQGLTTRATPDDMGAAIGRGLQTVAQGGNVAADAFAAVREMEDVAAAKEADNALAEWSRNAMYGDGGFMTLEGRAAVDGRAAFETLWETKRKEYGTGLTPGAARAYGDASVARRQQALQSIIVHQAQSRKKWFADSSAARIDTFSEDALASFADPKKVEFNIAAGQAELRQQAELLGWDADTLANQEDEFISGVRKNVALRIAQTDPLAAQAYVEAHREELTGPHQYDLEGALQGAVKEEISKSEAARIIGLIEEGEGDIESQLEKIEDDDVRDLTRTRINATLSTENRVAEAKVKAAKAELWSMIDGGASPDDVPFEVRQAAGMEAVASAWSFIEKRATRGEIVSDETLLYQMRRAAALDPVAFADVDLNDYRDRLSGDDVKELTGQQTSALADTRKAKDEGLVITTAFSQADDALRGVGISASRGNDREKEDAAKRIAEFQNVLAMQTEEFKRGHDGINPTQIEIQAMINKLLLPIVMKSPSGLFGWAGINDERNGFLFEAGRQPDGATVEIAVKYEDIPVELRRGIGDDLERELGRKPSPEEIADRYHEFIREGL